MKKRRLTERSRLLNALHFKNMFIRFITALTIFLSSCSTRSPENAAKEYCSCLKENYPQTPHKQRIRAKECNQLIMNKYYYHKVFNFYVKKSTYQTINQSTIDSAINFEMQFWHAADNYCCKETWRCE